MADTKSLKAVVSSLPNYRDTLSRLNMHVELCMQINARCAEHALREVGELEQDLVLGDKTGKELISALQRWDTLPPTDKVRLLICYAVTHPEKLTASKRLQWMKLSKVTAQDMSAVENLERLGVSVSSKGGGLLSRLRRKPKALRREAEGGEYSLMRFAPLMASVLEEMGGNTLDPGEYEYVRAPKGGTTAAAAAASKPVARSARTRGGSWAQRGKDGDGMTGPEGVRLTLKGGRRLVVFVVGGVTRSEIRWAHKQSRLLGREVILGSTSVVTPTGFVRTLQELSPLETVDV